MSAEETHNVVVQPVNKEKVKKIWQIAGILGIITTIEFILAFTVPRGVLLIVIFIGLTLLKAAYIVAEFMHLKYEVKVLLWSILIPLIFVVWMIIAFINEAGAILQVR